MVDQWFIRIVGPTRLEELASPKESGTPILGPLRVRSSLLIQVKSRMRGPSSFMSDHHAMDNLLANGSDEPHEGEGHPSDN